MKSVIGEGTAGMFVGSTEFQRAKLVVVRPTGRLVDIVLEMPWFVFCIQNCDHLHHVIQITTDFCSPSKFSRWLPYVCFP